MRPALLVLLVLGCSIGPPPGIAPPTTGTECGTLERGIRGTWVSDHAAMELRPDGSLLRDGVEGAFRWTAPGHATIDVAGSHEEHTFALVSVAELLDVDVDGHARVWTRVSLAPPYPDPCFELHGTLVGEWTDGAQTERFLHDGRWELGELRGRWSIPGPGLLEVDVGARVRRYRAALATPDLLVTTYEGPVVDEDPRGVTRIEARLP